jgi:lysophospholipase L1-like esterase
MKDERNGLQENLAPDGVHPNLEGYRIMETILIDYLK